MLSLLDGEQLEAETSVDVLQRFDGTQSEILEQNHGVLLQHERTVSTRHNHHLLFDCFSNIITLLKGSV